VTDIVAIAKACVDAGATGLTLINTTLGMVIDTKTMRPVLGGVTGGLSGPAIRPLAVRCVWQVHEALPEVPIFGVGGIRTGLDALEFILAGASAVQVGTVIFNDPGAPTRISRELREVLAARGMDRLEQAIGLGHRPPEEIIPELPDPPGDELEAIEIAERSAAPVTFEPATAVDETDEADEYDEAYDDEADAEVAAGPGGDDVPFDIEALDDFPSGDQDA